MHIHIIYCVKGCAVMVKICKVCGNEFEGYIAALYCSIECKKKAHLMAKQNNKNEINEVNYIKERVYK